MHFEIISSLDKVRPSWLVLTHSLRTDPCIYHLTMTSKTSIHMDSHHTFEFFCVYAKQFILPFFLGPKIINMVKKVVKYVFSAYGVDKKKGCEIKKNN